MCARVEKVVRAVGKTMLEGAKTKNWQRQIKVNLIEISCAAGCWANCNLPIQGVSWVSQGATQYQVRCDLLEKFTDFDIDMRVGRKPSQLRLRKTPRYKIPVQTRLEGLRLRYLVECLTSRIKTSEGSVNHIEAYLSSKMARLTIL